MSRTLLGAVVVCCSGVGFAIAADTISMARVKALDFEKNAITVTVDDKDQTYKVWKDAKIWKLSFNKDDKKIREVLLSGLSEVPLSALVTLTVEKKDFQDVVTEVKVGTTKKKKK